MVFAVANHEMAVFSPLDAGAMGRLNYEVWVRHNYQYGHPSYGLGRSWVGVADDTDLEISSLPYLLQEPPALTVRGVAYAKWVKWWRPWPWTELLWCVAAKKRQRQPRLTFSDWKHHWQPLPWQDHDSSTEAFPYAQWLKRLLRRAFYFPRAFSYIAKLALGVGY